MGKFVVWELLLAGVRGRVLQGAAAAIPQLGRTRVLEGGPLGELVAAGK